MARFECYRDQDLITKSVWEADKAAYEAFLREHPKLEVIPLNGQTGDTLIRITGAKHQIEHKFKNNNPDYNNLVSCIKLELEEIGIVVSD